MGEEVIRERVRRNSSPRKRPNSQRAPRLSKVTVES